MGDYMLLGFPSPPDITPEEYAMMAIGVQYHRQEAARKWTARRPLEIIQNLAKDSDETVRGHVALNPYTPASVLIDLSSDSSEGIRMKVARHRNTPESVRNKLAQDESELVRLAITGEV